uniref:Endonuclease/exonuclease/phosphatase domain-containing protein n=1 Tax=Aegilops tauschii subsp. strangulata TaxID=200361 RepID=A0A453DF18_AEGTS
MRGLIWNCRGVGKRGMATCLSDIISDHSIDFLGLQETLKRDFSPKLIRKFDPFGIFHWEWVPAVGRSGGILCGIRINNLELLS